MRAEVEQPDGTYVVEDRGEPICHKDFCGRCGDCLHCYKDACWDDGESSGDHRWVIYLNEAERKP